jgi:hypothetical protein
MFFEADHHDTAAVYLFGSVARGGEAERRALVFVAAVRRHLSPGENEADNVVARDYNNPIRSTSRQTVCCRSPWRL